MMWSTGENKGFSFVELMTALVILCAGLVIIIQGFILAASVLNRAQNTVIACNFMEEKLQALEIAAKKDNGIKRDEDEGSFSSLERAFDWNLDISSLKEEEDMDLEEDLNTVKLEVAWQEQNQPRGLSVATYVKNKKIE